MDFNLKAIFSADLSNLKKGFGQVTASLGSLDKGAKLSSAGVVDMFKGAGAGLATVGKTLSLGVTAPLVGIGVAAVKTGTDFKAQMNRVGAIAGATGKEMEALKKQALDLGASSIFSAKDVATAQEQMASAGFTTNQILAATPGLIDMAAVSGGDMGLAAEAASSAVRQFGLDIGETGHVADVYAKAAADTNAETQDMAEALKFAGPVAGSMGVKFEEAAAAIGIMSNAGIKGSLAGTALRGALTRLANPSEKASEKMEQLGISAFDANGKMKPLSQFIPELQTSLSGLTDEQKAAALATIFGQNAISGMMALVKSSPSELAGLTKGLENCDGAAKNMADRINSGIPGAFEELSGAVETAKIKIADAVEGPLTSVLGKITELVNKFNSLSPEMQENIVKWVGIAAVVGPAIFLFGKLVQGLSPIGGLLMTIVKHANGTMSGLASVGDGATKAGSAASMSAPQILAMGAAFVGLGAGIALAAIGLKILAEASVNLASAGPGAVAVMIGMVGALALLAKGASMIGPQLSAGAVGFVAFGAGLALAAVGVNLLSDAAIKLNAAGPGAIATLAGIAGGLAAFMAVAAAVGPGLTAGAVGFVAFGAGLTLAATAVGMLSDSAIKLSSAGPGAIAVLAGLGVGLGALIALVGALGPSLLAGGIGFAAFGVGLTLVGVAANLGAVALQKIVGVLPSVVQYGASGAASIAALGASMAVFAAGAAAGDAGALVLAAGLAALALALGAAGAAALVAGAGMAVISVTLPIIASSGMAASAAILALSGAMVPMAATSVALSASLVALTATLVAATVGFTAYSVAVGLAAAGTGLLVAGLVAAQASLTAINTSANATAQSLQTMVTSIDVVKVGLSGIKDAGKSALDGLISVFDNTAERAKTAGQQTGANYTSGLSTGLSQAQASATSKLTGIAAAFTSSSTMITGTVRSQMSAITSQTNSSLSAMVSTTRGALSGISQTYSQGLSAIGRNTTQGYRTMQQTATTAMTSIRNTTTQGMAGIVTATTQGMMQFSQRMATGTQQAVASLRSGLSQAVASANGYRGAFQSAGYNLSMGMASGIYAGQSAVINAAADVAASAVYAAQRRLQIHSPSKVMEKKVGRYVPEGMAKGILGEAGSVKSAMQSVSDIISGGNIPDVSVGKMFGNQAENSLQGIAGNSAQTSKTALNLVLQMGSHAWEILVDDITQAQDGKTEANMLYLGQGA
ncbi:phage tail tape measure protein [Murdochiella massiliensis]|uniref:phage tail tape measure protein n=1 Tax=Murdochiella massiliensis TaxID=1673723 RepID=UPI00082B78B3|nr:phage tail tape measure protein [Murdochiella massiliensis]